jgi:hypothetical protein
MTALWGVALCISVKPSNSIAAILPLKIKRGNENTDGKKENEKRKDTENQKQKKLKDYGNRKENEIMNKYRKENEYEKQIENVNSKKEDKINRKNNNSEENLKKNIFKKLTTTEFHQPLARSNIFKK